MEEFTFKYQSSKGGKYFLLGIFGVPFTGIFASSFLIDYISWIFWVTGPLVVAGMVYFIILFAKKSKAVDTIQIDDKGFTSENYGLVLYSDIHSIPPYGPLQAPPPSMRIKLHNGKKLVWYLDANNVKATDDVATFIAFREELLLRLKQQTIESIPPKMPYTNAPVNKEILKEEDNNAEIVQQLEKTKKRDYKYIAIPFSLVLGLLFFFRGCGEDLIRTHKEKEFSGVRNSILRIETDYEENRVESRNVIDTYTKNFGPISVLTNDAQAGVKFLPDIKKNTYSPKIEIIGLRRTEDNEILEKVINHPDSFQYRLVAFNNEKDFLIGLDRGIFSEADSAAATVYFAVYNPEKSLPSKFRSKSDTAFNPISYSTSISVPKTGKITKAYFKNMDYASIRSILHQYEGTYFYMAVKEDEGISPERFEQIEAIVMADLKEYNINVEQFQRKRFNTE